MAGHDPKNGTESTSGRFPSPFAFLAILLTVGLLGIGVATRCLDDTPRVAEEVVLVATRDLTALSLIRPGDMKEVKRKEVPKNAISDISRVQGYVSKVAIPQGTSFTYDSLLQFSAVFSQQDRWWLFSLPREAGSPPNLGEVITIYVLDCDAECSSCVTAEAIVIEVQDDLVTMALTEKENDCCRAQISKNRQLHYSRRIDAQRH